MARRRNACNLAQASTFDPIPLTGFMLCADEVVPECAQCAIAQMANGARTKVKGHLKLWRPTMHTPLSDSQLQLVHAVVFVDHHSAQVVRFGREQAQDHNLHDSQHVTHQHASGVRSEHDLFGEVCDDLDGVTQVLITGGRQGLAKFRDFVATHRPQTAKHIAGYEMVGHPSEKQLVVIARKYFAQHDRMVDAPATP